MADGDGAVRAEPRPTEPRPPRPHVAGGQEDWRSLLKCSAGSPGRPPVPRRCLENVLTTLRHCPEWQGVLRYNEFTDRVEIMGPVPRAASHETKCELGPWRDGCALWVTAWFNDKLGFEPSIDMVDRAIDEAARQIPWHPVRAYLCGLRWDERPRLDSMLTDLFGAEDTPVTRSVGAKWMLSAVARVLNPGCQVDHILVLEGAQGIGKSSALRALVGDDWFRNSPMDLRSKDSPMALRGCWIYEFDELESFRGRDAARVKSFVTARKDSYRPAYGRRVIDVPRECVFAASTNEDRYLSDPTGNRRFWPVRCGAIKLSKLAALRDQLWAEAYARYAAGEPWHVDSPALAELVREQQAEREEIDPWLGLTDDWLRSVGETASDRGVTTHQVLVDGLRRNPGETTRRDEMRMGHVLKALGWERRRVRDGQERGYRYFPPGPTCPRSPHRNVQSRDERNRA